MTTTRVIDHEPTASRSRARFAVALLSFAAIPAGGLLLADHREAVAERRAALELALGEGRDLLLALPMPASGAPMSPADGFGIGRDGVGGEATLAIRADGVFAETLSFYRDLLPGEGWTAVASAVPSELSEAWCRGDRLLQVEARDRFGGDEPGHGYRLRLAWPSSLAEEACGGR